MLFYPGVMISRTRSRGGLMPTWGDSQRYSVDYSNTAWGSDVDFSVLQAQNVWIRTLYDRHRFVMRANLGWIETGDFDKVPPDLRFFAGATAVFAAINTNLFRLKTATAILKAPQNWQPDRWSTSITSPANGGGGVCR